MASSYTTPTVRATTDVITSAIWNTDVVANIIWLATDAPYCRTSHSVNQSIANSTTTALAFDTETFDNGSLHDTVTNNSRITFAVAGKYVIGGNAQFGVSATGARSVSVRKTGGNNVAFQSQETISSGAFATAIGTPSPFTSFGIGDYVELTVFQSSGGSINVEQATDYSPTLWAYLIRI